MTPEREARVFPSFPRPRSGQTSLAPDEGEGEAIAEIRGHTSAKRELPPSLSPLRNKRIQVKQCIDHHGQRCEFRIRAANEFFCISEFVLVLSQRFVVKT